MFADRQTERGLLGWTVPASWFQSINAVAIVLFAPIFAWLWQQLGTRKLDPSTPVKMSLGFVFLGLGYLVIAFGVKGVEPDVKVSMMWLIGLYLLHTFGELCLSPIGLSAVSKLSPPRFASLMMGVWYLASARGQQAGRRTEQLLSRGRQADAGAAGLPHHGSARVLRDLRGHVGRRRRGAVPAGAAHLALEPRPGVACACHAGAAVKVQHSLQGQPALVAARIIFSRSTSMALAVATGPVSLKNRLPCGPSSTTPTRR